MGKTLEQRAAVHVGRKIAKLPSVCPGGPKWKKYSYFGRLEAEDIWLAGYRAAQRDQHKKEKKG